MSLDLRDLLVIGRTGQLARELARIAPEATLAGRDTADLMHPSECAALVRASGARAVINAAAWTAVDDAEAHPSAAAVANAEAPGAMAYAAKEAGIPFVHVSTDYVFDGQGTAPFAPGDPTAPLGAYGASKLEGEIAVEAALGAHAIIRTSWVFSAHGRNFVKTMLALAEARDTLTVVSDQTGGPTPAADLARACLAAAQRLAIDPALRGTYHFAGTPDTTWADFAREIFARAGKEVDVSGIATADYPTPAPRPLNSRLDCTSFVETFGVKRPDWREGLGNVLRELGAA